MKYILFLCLTVLLFSCKPSYKAYKCKPSKKSRDYAKIQNIKQRSDGYYEVTAISRMNRIDVAFECKPTLDQLDSLKRTL